MKAIFFLQERLIDLSIALLVGIPFVSIFLGTNFVAKNILFEISFAAVFLVMIVRPLADIFSQQLWLRRLVILRKGFGILSASIIVGFMLATILAPDSTYLVSLFTARFWTPDNYIFFAHAGDISGFILLITSNQFSQRLLKRNWKRIQRLSYVYFYAGGIYEAIPFHNSFAFYALWIVTILTLWAWGIKVIRRMANNEE